MRSVKKILTTLLTISFLFGELVHANEKVVCIGQGGHFALEEAVNGNCGGYEKDFHDHSADQEHSHPLLSEDDKHCGNCDDYSLKNGGSLICNTYGNRSLLLYANKTHSITIAKIIFPELKQEEHFLCKGIGLSPSLKIKRTTVLLI